MARIRTIKPEFCTSRDVGSLSRDARLFFLQLLTECDDEGRLLWIPRRLCGVLYPHDEDVTAGMLEQWASECQGRGMVRIYQTPAGAAMAVLNWSKHQKISHPGQSRIAAPPDDSGQIPEPSGKPPEEFRKAPEEITEAPEVLRPDLGTGKGMEQGTLSGHAGPLADFGPWYSAYPRHEARGDAEKAWVAVKARPPLEVLLAAVEWQKRSGCLQPREAEGRSLIPLPATWLRKTRWLDERSSQRISSDGIGSLSAAEFAS